MAHLPVVGDWILVEPGPLPSDPWSVSSVLPRRSSFSRGAAGTGSFEQVLAANVDVVWIVHGLYMPLNARRLERYLAIGWESGAVPEVILTKADLASDMEAAKAEAQEHATGVRVWAVSSTDVESVTHLRDSLREGKTVVLLGPSGAGKSTLVNSLAVDDRAATAPVREKDQKGRHTTTRRELYRIPGGALLLDTPGIRELRVWTLGDGLDQAFPEIRELAQRCRFGDCRHDTEPGCAVRAAEAAGGIDPERLANFKKLQAEAAYQMKKTDVRAQQAALSEHKTALKTMKYHHKFRRPE
jgi:ribosome biogenesis GTPase